MTKFKPFHRLTQAQSREVKARGWHGYRARNSDEWHLRFEISYEFYRLDDADSATGLPFRINGVANYQQAARIVLNRYDAWKRKHLKEGYACVYTF